MKKTTYLISLLSVSCSLFALPEGADVAAGQAEFHAVDGQGLRITTSDKTIINYQKFDIGKGEYVEFVQPSAKSTVLNRVKGQDPSEILGKLSSNGRLFLVNPNGIYFGPDAVVNTGSFVASTLNIGDEDFLNDRFEFFLEKGSEQSKIINEGRIAASVEGFIGMMAPIIQNKGSIFARAEKIALSSAERVTLDFTGDGLIRFKLEGDLEKAVIENYGQIEALNGQVSLSLRAAQDAIKMVVNTDGLDFVNDIVESNGIIRLVSTSQIQASSVHIEGNNDTKVEVEGIIDASSSTDQGGSVWVLGEHVRLIGAKIDVSGELGGGEVLIGGDYKGQGIQRNAQTTRMDEESMILADARRCGPGGKVVLWADDTTLFNGFITARGGLEGGDGGFVETSGKNILHTGRPREAAVNALAPWGRPGDWLLDPTSITVAIGGGGTLPQAANCPTGASVTIAPATINAAAANVILCATNGVSSSITVTNAISMTNSGISLSLTAGSGSTGPINLNAGITTRGGAISMTGVVTLGASLTLNTTNATPAGANISFSNTINGSGVLTLNAGTGGAVTLSNAVGGITSLIGLSVTAASITQSSSVRTIGGIGYTTSSNNIGGNITTTLGGAINISGPVVLTGTSTVDTTNGGATPAGATITFSNTVNGAHALTIRSGTSGNINLNGAVGGTTPLTSLTAIGNNINQSSTVKTTGAVSYTGSTAINPSGNITTSGGTIGMTGPVVIASSPTFDTTNGGATPAGASISFSSTLNGATALTLQGGTGGTVTLGSAVGATTALTSLAATGSSIVQSSSAKTTGAVTYTAPTSIAISGNITTSGSAISITGPVTMGIGTNPILDSTNGGASAAGANITLSSTANGSTSLTFRAGTGGIVSLGGAVGGTTPLTNLVFTSANRIDIGSNITVTGANPLSFPFSVVLTGTSTITSNNANTNFVGIINGAQALTVAGGSGSVTLSSIVGGVTPLTSLTVSGSLVSPSSPVTTTGNVNLTGSSAVNIFNNITTSGGAISLTGPVSLAVVSTPTFDTTNGGATPAGNNISFSTSANGNAALTLNGGTGGTVTLGAAVGATTALTSFTATGSSIVQSSSVKTIGAVTYTAPTSITMGGNITTSGAVIGITGPMLISGSPTLDSTNSGASAAGANITLSSTVNGSTSLTFRAGTGGIVSLGGAVGGTTPLTNLVFTSANRIDIGSNITVTGANPLNFTIPVNLTGASIINSNNGNISFTSSLNGANALTLNAGVSGNITFTGAVGGVTPLTSLTISNASNVTAAAITAGALVQSAGTGTTTFNGAVSTTGVLGISLTGTNFAWNANITTTGGGPLNVSHSGTLTGANGIACNLSGAFNDLGVGPTTFGGNITTNGSDILFTPALSLGTSIVLSTGTGIGNISFLSTLDGTGPSGGQNLTLAADGGNITWTGAVGGTKTLGTMTINSANNATANAITAGAISQLAGTGTTTFNGAISLTSAAGISITGHNVTFNNAVNVTNTGGVTIVEDGTLTLSSSAIFTIDGPFTQSGTGVVHSAGSIATTNDTIQMGGAVILTGATTLNTGAGAGNIIFSSTLNGPGNANLSAGTGNITFTGSIGNSTRLGILSITSATNVNAASVTADSISQTGVTGTSTYNGNINTDGVAGVSLTGNIVNVNGDLVTTGSGPFTINNSGQLNLTAGNSTSLSGAFAQTGAGAVNFAGKIFTNNVGISFASPITLTNASIFDTNSGAGSILFSSTIDGAQTLTLASGTGNITFSGNVGVTNTLTSITINTAANVTTQELKAGAIAQLSGSGTSTFNGALTTVTVSGIDLIGNAFTFHQPITTTTGSGPLLITNTGLATFASSAAGVIGGNLTQMGGGSVSLANTFTVTGAVSWGGSVSIPSSQTATLTTAAANQSISFSSTIEGPGNLIVSTGGGNLTLSGAVGSSTRLGDLTISSASNVTTAGIKAASILQSAGTGLTTLTGTLDTNGASGIALTLTSLNQNGSIITTSSGPVTIINSSTMTSVLGGSTSISGAFIQNGAGGVTISGTLLTVNQPVSFSSAMTLGGALSIDSGTGGTNTITLSGSVNGAQALTLASGTGDITLPSALGGVTPLTSLTISSVKDLSASAITAGTLTQSAGSGTSTFNSTVSTTAAGGISIAGTAVHFVGAVTTTNGGVCTLNNSGTLTVDATAPLLIDGIFQQTGAGSVSLGANVTTNNSNATFAAPVNLTATVAVSTGPGLGGITFSSTLSGAQAFTATAGTGNVVFSGTIGSTPLTSLTISGHHLTLANIGGVSAGVNGATSMTGTGTVTFNGITYNAAIQTYTGNAIAASAGALTTFTTGGNPITFTASTMDLSATTNVTVNSAGGTIIASPLHAPINSLRTLTFNGGTTGAVHLSAVGTAGAGEFTLLSVTGGDLHLGGDIVSNTVTLSNSAPHQVFLGGSITTNGTALTFPTPVVRDTVITSTLTTGADIIFQDTIDGDGLGVRNLTLIAATGNITFTGHIGDVTPLDAITIVSCMNTTASDISVGNLTQVNGSGLTTFNGSLLTTNLLGISLTGVAFTFNDTVTTTNNGGVNITNTGLLTLPVAANCTLSGPFNQLSSGNVHLANIITTDDQAFFTGVVTLTGATSISTAATNKTITFLSTVDGANDLNLAAGTSSITFAADAGSITPLGNFLITTAQNISLQDFSALSITLNNGTGTATFGNIHTNGGHITVIGNSFISNGSITTTGGGNVHVTNSGMIVRSTSDPFDVDGAIIQDGTGPLFLRGAAITHNGGISIASSVTLVGNATFDTTGVGLTSGSDITFSSIIDGGFNIGLTSGAGNILFSGNIGSVTPVGAVTISNANNVTTQAISATSITQNAGSGTTSLGGAISTTGVGGISILANQITRGSTITTANGGPLTITNSGLFTSTAAGAISLDGSFTQNGAGNVQLAQSITTTGDNIAFASPITLMGNTTLNSGVGTGNITLSQTVQGGFQLNLIGDGGNITFGGNVGSLAVPLTSVTVTSANNWTATNITAALIQQLVGAGTTTFNGALTTTGASGISLTGTAFAFNGTFTTQAGSGGAFTLTNSGLATFATAATGSIDSAFTQNGTGAVELSNTIVAGGIMQLFGAVTVPTGNSATLNTSAVSQSITLTNTLDGPGNLTLSSGGGNITFSSAAGGVTPLGTLTVPTAQNWTTQAVSAGSIVQAAGTGTTLFNGNVNTTAAGGINLTGAAFTFLQNATAAGSGTITIVNTGVLTTTAGNTIASAGDFSQFGGGAVSLAGSITTTNSNLSLAGAITLTASSALSTGAGAGTITFNIVNGAFPLSLTAGTGDVNVTGAIGGVVRIGALTLNSAQNVTLQNVTAASISQVAGAGTTTLNGTYNTNAPAGMSWVGNNFSWTGSLVTTNGGSVMFTNAGTLTENALNTTSIDGSFIQNGVGNVQAAGSITTLQGAISYTSPIALIANTTWDSNNNSQDVTISSTLNGTLGTETLTIVASGGNIVFGGIVGGVTPIGTLTLSSGNNVTASSVTATSIATTTPLTGLASFTGAITTSAAGGVALSGNQFSFHNITTTGVGSMSLTNSGLATLANGSLLSIATGFTQTGAGSVIIGSSITTTNGNISFASPLTLTASPTLNTSAGGNNITISQTVDGAQGLTIIAGTGSLTLGGAVGATTPPTAFTLTSCNNATFSNNIVIAGPFTISAAAGTTTLNGTLTTTTAGGISITGNIININDDVTTTSGGPITVTNSGLLTIAAGSPILSSATFTQVAGMLQAVGPAVSIGSNVTTTGNIQFDSPVVLTNDVTCTSGGGNIVFADTINSDVGPAQDLTLVAGTGNITLTGALGGIQPLDIVHIQSANGAAAGAINSTSIVQSAGAGLTHFTGALATSGLAGISLTGNQFTIDQSITTTGSGSLSIQHTGLLTLNTTTHNLAGPFAESGGGAVSIGATIVTEGQLIDFADNLTLTNNVTLDSTDSGGSAGANVTLLGTVDGPFCLTVIAGTGHAEFGSAVGSATPLDCLNASGQTIFQDSSVETTNAVQYTGPVELSGNITTSGGNITITGAVTQLADSTLSSSGGTIHVTGLINPDVLGLNLTLQAGAGNITLDSSIGSIVPFANLTLTGNNISWEGLGGAAAGATGITSIIATTDLNFTGLVYKAATQSYTAGSNFNVNGVGAATLSSSSAPITFTTGLIQLTGTDLTINSNGGTITMDQLRGTGQDLTIDASTGQFNFTQIGETGQNLDVVTLTANTYSPTPVLNSNVFANSLSVNSPSSQTLTGAHPITGQTFTTPITVIGAVTFTCGAGGTITFNHPVNADIGGGSLSFDFDACGGSVVFADAVGDTNPLSFISVNKATNVTFSSTASMGHFVETNGLGTTTLLGGMTTTNAGGIDIATNVIDLTGAFVTTGGGGITLNNSGSLTVTSGSSIQVSGPFAQTGAGAVSIGGTLISSNALVSFIGAVTLNNDFAINTAQATGASISFASTVNATTAGIEDLTLTAGTGSITFGGALGGGTRLGIITINSAANVTNSAVTAVSYTQSAGTGTNTFNGAVNLNGVVGMVLTGSAFTVNNTIHTSATNAPISITNAGLLTLVAASNLTPAGNFVQNGAGLVSLGGQITAGGSVLFSTAATLISNFNVNTSANNQNITFLSTLNDALLHVNSLTLTAGSGHITLGGSVGGLVPIGALTIASAHDVSTQEIAATSIAQTAVVGLGLTTITGNMSTSGVGGIQLNGNQFNINGTIITAPASLGPFTITHTGNLSLTAGNSTLIDGSFTESGGGQVLSLSGTIATNNQPLSFADPITLTGPTTLNSGGGTLTLNTVDHNFSFTLVAGAGNIVFNGSIGGSTPIGAFTVSSANNLTYPLVNAVSLTQSASTGTTTLSSAVTTSGSGGVSITGATITQNGAITAGGTGGVAFTNAGALTLNQPIISGNAFTQTGSNVQLNHNITTTNAPLSFGGAVTLGAPSILSTGVTGGNINFADTLNGAQNLTLIAAQGSMSFAGAVGGVTRLGALHISSANNVTASNNVFAASIAQSAGTGTSTFSGNLDTNTLAGISLTGNNFSFQGNVTTTAGGPLLIINSGTWTVSGTSILSLAGSLNQTGSGLSSIGGAVTSTTGSATFVGPVVVTGLNASFDTQAASQPITFSSTLNGPGNLILNAGGGNITFSFDAGAATPLGALTVSSAGAWSGLAVHATSITQVAGSVSTSFSGDLSTTGALGIDLTSTLMTLLGNVTTTSGGPVSLTNSGLLSLPSGQTITSSGSFTQTGGGGVDLGRTITTTGVAANISFADPVNLTAASALSSSVGGGSITFSQTINGAFPLTLAAGTGNISLSGIIGGVTPLGLITITNGAVVNFAQAVTASALEQLAGSSATTIQGALTTTGPLGISLVGNDFNIQAPIVTQNAGPMTVTNTGTVIESAATVITVDAAFTQNGAGAVHLDGSITTNNATISFTGPITLDGVVALNSGVSGGNVILFNTVNGNQNLTINSGVGSISFGNAVGATLALNNLTLAGQGISLANIGGAGFGVSATTSVTSTSNVTFTGTVYNAHTQNYITSSSFAMNGGALTTFTSSGSPVTFSGGQIQLSAGTNLTINTTGGALTVGSIRAGTNSLRTVILNTGAATLQLGDIGLLGSGEFASTSLTGSTITLAGDIVSDAVTLAPSSTLFAGGSIYTTNTPLSFPTDVTLTGTNTFSTGLTGAAISFASTLNGDVDDIRGLMLTAGTGSITFTGAVGGIKRLSSLTVVSANDVTAQSITAGALFQMSGTGTTTFNGAVTVLSAVGIQLTGTNFAFSSPVTILNNGSLILANQGTATLTSTMSLSGGFTQSVNTGTIALSSATITTGQPVTIAGAVTLAGSSTVDTSLNSQALIFGGTINGAGALTLACSGGDLIFQQAIGGTTRVGHTKVQSAHNISFTTIIASSIEIVSSSGTATLNGSVDTNGALGISVAGNNFIANSGVLTTTGGGDLTIDNSGFLTGSALLTVNIDGFFDQIGTGPVLLGGTINTNNDYISFNSAVTVPAPVFLNTGAGAGNIIFNNTVDGPQDLNLTAGAGNISLSQPVGLGTRLGNLTIVSATDVTVSNDLKATTITQSSATGTTTFTGNVDTTGSGGIQLTGNNFIRGGNWTTTGGGIIVANTGNFTSIAAGTITTAGAFAQTGAGAVNLSQTIQTTNANLSFAGAVTLAGTTTLNTGAGVGSILFSQTVNGAQALILNSGIGDITFEQAVGGVTPLNNVTLQLAKDVTFTNLTAVQLSQTAGTGTTTLGGVTSITGLSGINLSGTSFQCAAAVTALNGPITIFNAGQLTISASCIAQGNFSQTHGTGTTSLSANITSQTGTITWSGPVTLNALPTLTTTNQPISLASTLNGPGGLTLNPGTSTIQLNGSAGNTTPLGALTFVSGSDISTLGIKALSITQTAGSGTTSMIGNLQTTGATGINLNGNHFALSGSWITTNGGPMTIAHTGLLNLQAGVTTLLSGPFSETGVGNISLAGTLHANDQTITFVNPITLVGSTTLNSDGGADITINSTIDGAQDLTLDAGNAGDITISAAIGSITPITSLTIVNAANVITSSITTTGSITQSAGGGSSSFGTLSTQLGGSINLTGSQFTFNGPITTTGSGFLQITNSGTLTIPNGSPIQLGGSFSQLGAGAVTLCTNITANNGDILFTAPVTLCDTITLNTTVASGDITFLSTINGAQALSLQAGAGDIQLSGAIGQLTHLTMLQVSSAHNVTAQGAVTSQAVNFAGITAQTTFNNTLTTTGLLGIALAGKDFSFNGAITTTNGGAMTLTNSGVATFLSNQTLNLDGSFLQNGSGNVLIGGVLTTPGQSVQFVHEANLTGNWNINTSGGNITLTGGVDGGFDLTLQAGAGNIFIFDSVGDEVPLHDLNIVSAQNVTLAGIGNTSAGVTGICTVVASGNIDLGNTFYAGTQSYSAGGTITFTVGSLVHVVSFGGPISFLTSPVVLNPSTDLNVETNNGAFSFIDITGSTFENITINTGSGAVHLNNIGPGGTINTVTVNGGSIDFTGTIDTTNAQFTALGAIFNATSPSPINSNNDALFNALGGNVGTLSSPVLVNTNNKIYAGAGGSVQSRADFDGTSVDNTVHVIPSNPPCIIIFNGIVIKQCEIPPTPSPIPAAQKVPFPFAVPGFDSSYFNLASDYFFLPYFFNDDYIHKHALMYYRDRKAHARSR